MAWTEKDLKNLQDRGLTLAQTGMKEEGGPAPLRAKAKKTNNNPDQLKAGNLCIKTTDIGAGVYNGIQGINYYYYQTQAQYDKAWKEFNNFNGLKVEKD